MKKIYLSPEAEVAWVTIEKNILSNGENLSMRDYGTGTGEDVDNFWN